MSYQLELGLGTGDLAGFLPEPRSPMQGGVAIRALAALVSPRDNPAAHGSTMQQALSLDGPANGEAKIGL